MRTVIVVFLAAAGLSLEAQPTDAEAQLMRWLGRIAQQQLDKRDAEIRQITTVEAAERRKEWVRKKILELIGGLPDYAGPLNPKVGRRIIWTDPTNWMQTVVPLKGNFRYRYLSEGDEPFLEELLR